ncbi:protein ARV1 isoform X1 [Drosophila tropicalis]|uniref:protein ARV1 isoform X1 n=1 Tax=Drosophila tropicalis TaxID=46794 RepID=UPI0035ABA7BF
MSINAIKPFVCINCGHRVRELYKKYSNTLKTTHCDKCHQITDKYIEFEEFIILIDALLLDSCAFRHIIYNGNFKIHWKVFFVVLLLESFALCRYKHDSGRIASSHLHERGFYMCTIQNIGEYLLISLMLLLITAFLELKQMLKFGLLNFTSIILKVVAISNLSKFFLLPILVWRNNTTDFGRNLHYMLVTSHHLCSLVLAYEATRAKNLRWISTIFVISAFALKEYFRYFTALQIESFFI